MTRGAEYCIEWSRTGTLLEREVQRRQILNFVRIEMVPVVGLEPPTPVSRLRQKPILLAVRNPLRLRRPPAHVLTW